ncbi:MAG: hypothetical protein R2991_07630 [Thermoanaerobaculia bacterium]
MSRIPRWIPAVVVLPAALWAMEARPVPEPRPPVEGRYIVGNPAGLWFRHDAAMGLSDSGAAALALAGFQLTFGPGRDHGVAQIAVWDAGLAIEYALHGHGDDYFLPRSWHLPVVASRLVDTEARQCSGPCTIPIDPPAAGEVFVLRGLRFARARERSGVRRFSVRPDPGRGVVHVELSERGASAYRASLQYAYLPATEVTAQLRAEASRSAGSGEETLVVSRQEGVAALQGFSLELAAGARPLGDLAIVPSVAGPPAFRVRFNDRDPDEAYAVSIDYVLVR